MNLKIRCPHCGKELNIPEHSGKIFCMYCSGEIDTDLLADQNREEYLRCRDEMEAALDSELFTAKIDITRFTAKFYTETFDDFLKLLKPALNAFRQASKKSEDLAADDFAELLFQKYNSEYNSQNKNSTFALSIRFTITSLLIPAVLQEGTSASKKVVEKFLSKWNHTYPKEPLSKATYDEICAGFKKKLCYITTAVCKSLGASDDCAELNAFREFRDRWLSSSPDGPVKIAEYYLFAPLIVRAIDRSDESGREYRRIWEEYLSPCLSSLHSGKVEKCALDYEKMVKALERKWLS